MSRINIVLSRFALAATIAALPVGALAQTDSTASDSARKSGKAGLTISDKTFVRKAAEGGMAEVELGKLATEKASSDAVKKFGQRMVDDHTKAGDKLKEIASSKGIQVPEKLNAKDKMTKDRLSKLSGDQFDKAYMRDMVKDHVQDVADFQRESTAGTDSDVKAFASKTLPTLKDHLREAKKIAPPSSTAQNNMKSAK